MSLVSEAKFLSQKIRIVTSVLENNGVSNLSILEYYSVAELEEKQAVPFKNYIENALNELDDVLDELEVMN